MPQHDDIARPYRRAVLDHELVPRVQRRGHGRPYHLGEPVRQRTPALRLTIAALLVPLPPATLGHPAPPGPFLHQYQRDTGLLS
ncbi:hypothetical protein [Streptomyces sp. 8N706]|uniref:hypothetical protein n=1 Tax=Streptomyces sp. 8N706 TaxID=3457416 RepID=UPI003FD28BAA